MGRVGQVVPVYGAFGDDLSLAECVAGAQIVVNLVGILAEGRRGDFDRVHHRGAGRIAKLAADLKPGDLDALQDSLRRIPVTRGTQEEYTNESTLGTLLTAAH